MTHIPYLEGEGKSATLYVDGKPFHARSGEIHNSSASDLDYMEKRVWPGLRLMHMNCVIAPIYWECIEPEQGVFDYTLMDGLIAQARREGVKLVLLWFGLWKNGESTYVPEWVKRDQKTYWYAKGRYRGNALENTAGGMFQNKLVRTISPLCQAAVDADANAFAHVMAHLREVDEERTVITIQVENETGILGASRDYSPEADALFAQEVPAELAQVMGVSGSWSEAFGEFAGEPFMAWQFSKAVEQITRAGKAEYPLPMYVNCWLENAPWQPGVYPSGGPQFRNYRIWKTGAPSVDIISPDAYADYFRDVCALYGSEGNPLFIPETRVSAPSYLYAVGSCNVMCYAPFAIDSAAIRLADPEAPSHWRFTPEQLSAQLASVKQLSQAYAAVEDMEDVIEKAHQEGRIRGFLEYRAGSERVELSHIKLQFNYDSHGNDNQPIAQALGGGLVIEMDDYEFIVLGVNCSLTFRAKEDSSDLLDILTKEEGRFIGNQWVRGRILNGDERNAHVFGSEPSFLRFKLLPYQD